MVVPLDITKRLHDRLMEIVNTAFALITPSLRDADLAGLAYLRREMIQLLEIYSDHVDAKIESMEGDEALRYLEVLQDSLRQLSLSYEKFRARWVHREATQNWPEYRLSCVVMMKQFRDHLTNAEQARQDFRTFQRAATPARGTVAIAR
jgi:hypothetical protein